MLNQIKILLLVSFVLLNVPISFSQSKKKQIEALNSRLDSLTRVVQNERVTHSQKVSTLEIKIDQLNGEISNSQEQLRQKQRIIDEKDNAIKELQNQIKSLTDSMSTLQIELTKLKPIPKEEVKESVTVVVETSSFKTVKIGTQIWMKENLNVSTFRNGDVIPEAKTADEWKKAGEDKQPAWCYFNYDSKNGTKYGKYYNWYAVNDPRGLAPEGWHVPSDKEWEKLENLMPYPNGANKLKSLSGWNSYETGGSVIPCTNCENASVEYKKICPRCKGTQNSGKKTPKVKHSGNGNNSSGFSALPSGRCLRDGSFFNNGESAMWWSTSKSWGEMARTQFVSQSTIMALSHSFEEGMPVRCIRDISTQNSSQLYENSENKSGVKAIGGVNGQISGDMKNEGKKRTRLSGPSVDHIQTLTDETIYLKLTVNANGVVVSAENIPSKTTTTDQDVINQVITAVKKQVKYSKDNSSELADYFIPVSLKAK